MHSLLTRLLKKRGIKDPEELDDTELPDGSPSEKKVFQTYKEILSKEELTIEDIKQFCVSQLTVIEGKWSDLNITNEKKAEWIPYHTVYKILLTAIESPKAAREALENHLINLIK